MTTAILPAHDDEPNSAPRPTTTSFVITFGGMWRPLPPGAAAQRLSSRDPSEVAEFWALLNGVRVPWYEVGPWLSYRGFVSPLCVDS